jgi:hypothetical protein
MLVFVSKYNDMLHLLEQANKHKTEFLCRMSHELRYYTNGIS